jgi:hypothetical protein
MGPILVTLSPGNFSLFPIAYIKELQKEAGGRKGRPFSLFDANNVYVWKELMNGALNPAFECRL